MFKIFDEAHQYVREHRIEMVDVKFADCGAAGIT
jgi:hypothetical protein